MTRARARGLLWSTLICASAAAFIACSDAAGPTHTVVSQAPASPFAVSNPHLSAAGALRSAGAGGATDDIVYVALPAGAIPNAELVTIHVRGTSTTVSATAIDGGLDPVAVPAGPGDTLEVEVKVTGLATPVRYVMPVPKSAKPIVIRTSPPPKKRDVPLNTNVIVVFSEPIALGTVTATSMQLTSGSTRVEGQISPADPAHVSTTLTPTAPLAPSTDYTLTITQAIQDLDGQALDSAVTVQFTTSAAPPPAPAAFDGVWSGTTSEGRAIRFTVAGTIVRDVTVGFRLTGDCGIAGFTPTIIGQAGRLAGTDILVGDTASVIYLAGSFQSPSTASGLGSTNYSGTFSNGTVCHSKGAATWSATKP